MGNPLHKVTGRNWSITWTNILQTPMRNSSDSPHNEEMGFTPPDEEDPPETSEDDTRVHLGALPKELKAYAVDLNSKAREGKIDSVVGRTAELERTIQILCRRRKNNPLFVGEPGVGKTAIAEGLARLIVEGNVPPALMYSIIFSLDVGALVAGTMYRGDFEKRFKKVLTAMRDIPGAILFIDEIHMIVGAGSCSGSTIDAANMLKPLLASGEIHCIGSTTYDEYRNVFEKDKAIARRFQKIDVGEPSVEETYEILKGLKTSFEIYHEVTYTASALMAAAKLADRHINDRRLPDKAIDVVDEAGAYQKQQGFSGYRKVIGVAEIEFIVARLARIPVNAVSASDTSMLQSLSHTLKMLVFGQDMAIDSLTAAIKLARSGLREPTKPVGCFLLSGPTGVGKTEVTQQLAKVLGIDLIRFDMSEYMERHMISRLIGAPPGYVGYEQAGLLTEAVIKHPHSVVLLDEIEKAHPDIFNLLLQIMDYGTLTDNNGRVADFRHITLIMTTNAGSADMEQATVGFTPGSPRTDDLEALKHLFSPEFRNRLDAVIPFKSLSDDTLLLIVDKFLEELKDLLRSKHVRIVVDKASRQYLATHGYNQKMGARPMARLIQKHIKQPLAEELLFGKLVSGGLVKIKLRKDELVCVVEEGAFEM